MTADTYSDQMVWEADRLLRARPDMTLIKEMYVVHVDDTGDDMGGLDNYNGNGQSDSNTTLCGISPHCLEGEYDDAFVCSVIIAQSDKEVKRVCEAYPDINIYYTIGISTYPYNDKNVDYRALGNRLNKLQQRNLHIAFVNGWDMYLDEFKEFDRCKKIKNELAEFDNTKLKFLMANFTICQKYKAAMPHADVQYYTIYPTRIADSPGKASWPDSIINKTGNKLRFKKLVCLNNFTKGHRCAVVDTITPYAKDIYYSYRDKGIYLKKESVNSQSRHKDGRFLRNQDSPPYRVISSAYAWVANETFFNSTHSPTPCGGDFGWGEDHVGPKEVTGFITEKTLKGFFFELPVFVVGLARTYQQLHKMGFETFPEIFDESFDNIMNDDERIIAIQKELVTYLDTPLRETHERFFSPMVQEKIAHNKNLILTMAKSDPFNRTAWTYKYPDK